MIRSFFANLVSVVFHPLIIPTYAFIVVLLFHPQLYVISLGNDGQYILLRVLINTFLFPGLAIFLMYRLKIIQSIQLKDSKDRIIPFIAVSTFYFWTYLTFKESEFPPILYQIMLAGSIALFAGFFVNAFVKVSIHTTAMGCFFMLMLYLTFISSFNLSSLLVLVILAAGAVGTSRLYLIAHQPKEVYLGYFIGVISHMIAFNF